MKKIKCEFHGITPTGGRQCVGQPTLNRNNYMSLMRQIRKGLEERNGKGRKAEVSASGQAEGGGT